MNSLKFLKNHDLIAERKGERQRRREGKRQREGEWGGARQSDGKNRIQDNCQMSSHAIFSSCESDKEFV